MLAQFIYTLTASTRFDGTLNTDAIEFQTNLAPDPRKNFMRGSSVLVISAEQAHHEQLSMTKFALPILGPRPHEGQVHMRCALPVPVAKCIAAVRATIWRQFQQCAQRQHLWRRHRNAVTRHVAASLSFLTGVASRRGIACRVCGTNSTCARSTSASGRVQLLHVVCPVRGAMLS